MDNVIIYDKLEELNEGIEYNGGGHNCSPTGHSGIACQGCS